MSELLKRADSFNSLNDGISGKNPVDAQLVADLAERVRHLENKKYAKRIAVGFFQYWWNSSGINPEHGFDDYWKKLLMNDLELPGIQDDNIRAEDTIPIDRGRDADRNYHTMMRRKDRSMPRRFASDEEG